MTGAIPGASGTVVRASDEGAGSGGAPGARSAIPRFSVGDRISDTYEVKRIIEGGMGTVYVCYHERWRIDLVVKAPHEEVLAEHAHRIEREAEAWTELGLHPHIAYCFYVHPLDGVPLVVIEYLDGGNLRDWIGEGRCADLKVGLDLAVQFCHGLEHAHARGLIHRDIKPENVLLASDGTLKITDFGIVRAGRVSGVTSLDIPASGIRAYRGAAVTVGEMGTPEYMAPEQWADAHDVDERTDIFAFGVCLYEMFCGRRPYEIAVGSQQEPPEPRALRGDDTLPERLCTLLKRCGDWDRPRRPASVKEVRHELCGIYEELFQRPSAWAELPEVSLEADGWNNRGVTYLELKQEGRALECCAQALQTNPRHLEATYNQALLQWRRGEIGEAEVLRRLEGLSGAAGIDARELAVTRAEIHQEHFDPEAARATLAPYPGLYEEHFREGSSRIALLYTLEGHSSLVSAVALSGDGRRALSGSRDRTLKLWDLETGRCLRTLKGHSGGVFAVALSTDGHRALSGSEDRALKLWDLGKGRFLRGRCLHTLGHSGGVMAVALSADGHRALSGSLDRTLKLWDLETGECLRTLEGHSVLVHAIALSADGHRALSGSEDDTLKLWDLETGRCLRTLKGHSSGVNAVALSADGHRALSGSSDHTLKLWNLDVGRRIPQRLKLCQPRQFAALRAQQQVLQEGIRQITTLCAAGQDQEAYHALLQIWEPIGFRPEVRLDRIYTQLRARGTIKHPLSIVGRSFTAHRERVTSVALTPDGHGVLSGSLDRTLKLWDLETGECLCTLEGHLRELHAVALSADGRRALSGSGDRTLKLWDLETGRCLRTLEGHSSSVTAVALSADGHRALSSGSLDDTLKLWDLKTGECLRTLGHPDFGQAVALSGDGHRALSGSGDRTLKLWDLETGRCLRTLEGHSGGVFAVALSGDGHRALSGSLDHTLKLWDLETGECLRTLPVTSGVASLAMTPDACVVVSAHADRTLTRWHLIWSLEFPAR